ncbi:MAG: hypothetical protein KGH67_05460, partial [Candidatus Micrarchaeota archaeon]|nr:hypothetical protein [Candidatus Micrarchaeota archaeon]
VVILTILVVSAAGICNIGGLLVQGSTIAHYQNPIQYSQIYLSNLMFNQGLGLFTNIYSESILLTVTGNMAEFIEKIIDEIVISQTGISLGSNVLGVYYGFSGALTSTFTALIAVAFGVIFTVYLLLPIIQAIAFPVILPVALIMRSIPFAGPNLRQSADTFLALAIGFYLIFPLTILLNQFIITFVYTPCGTGPVGPSLCNPYSQYNQPYQISSFPPSSIFSSQTIDVSHDPSFGTLVTGFQTSYLTSGFGGTGGFLAGIQQIIESILFLPQIIIGFAVKTAQYLFQGIFLIGLDLAITVGFAQGLSKGLGAVGRMLGVGPFWGG